jgi:hypothetical protein
MHYLNDDKKGFKVRNINQTDKIQIETVTPSDWVLGPQKHCY